MNSDQMLVDSFIRKTKEEDLRVYWVRIHRNGELTASFSRMPAIRFPGFSISKGFVSCAAGIAESEGLIRLDEKIVDIFPEYLPSNPSENLCNITLENCLTMTAGQNGKLFMSNEKEARTTKNWLKYFFEQDFVHKPGTFWEYSNFNTYIVNCAIEKRAGENLVEYLRERLFEPLGIGNPEWRLCPMGHVNGGAGIMIDIDELSNYSQLILNLGKFNGKQLVPQDYMKKATSKIVDNIRHQTSQNKAFSGWGYGYQYLMNSPVTGGYRSTGAKGDYAIALPEKNATVSVISMEDRMDYLGTVLFEEIVNKL